MVIDSGKENTFLRAAGVPPSPQAARLRRRRWLTGQTVVGVLLILFSIVLGSRVVSAADDTVPVLVTTQDLSPGQPLTADMVELADLRFEGGYDHYYTGAVGDGYVVTRPVGAGELLARTAVAAADEIAASGSSLRYVTVSVPQSELPPDLAPGDVVDAWVTPVDGAEKRQAQRLAEGLTVTATDGGGGALGVDGAHAAVTLAVSRDDVGDADDEDALDSLVGGLMSAGRDGRVYLARLPDRG
jgi:Flp pilus assembly protein CpaB